MQPTDAIYPSLKDRVVFVTGGGAASARASSSISARRARGSPSSTCRRSRRRRWSSASPRAAIRARASFPCDLRDIDGLQAAIERDAERGRADQGPRQQCRQRRSPLDRRRHVRLLGRPHGGQPPAPVLRRPGGAPADARCGRRLDHQFRLDHLAGRRPRLHRLCHRQGGDQRLDPRARPRARPGAHPRQLRACPAGS